jgi:uncharacterized phage-associated protein
VQGFSPFGVAKFFVEKATSCGTGISPMKLIKLAYISHGWHLALFDAPLIYEPVQAWKYGPVIESLYHAYKHLGNSNIPIEEVTSPPELGLCPDFPQQSKLLLEKVWAKYSGLTAVHLSALTHQSQTPWYKVWHENGGKDQRCAPIPDALIKEFYRSKLNTQTVGSGH